MRTILAWLVHAYTATGLVLAAGLAILIIRGGDEAFRLAFLLMVAATFVDATDGWLARRARVKDVLPGFDGRRLDDIIDFQTYTFLPLLLLWRTGVLPDVHEPWLLVPLVASAYGFCQVQAKTADNYFLGFPSYWNIVVFYVYLLHPPPGLTLGILLGLAVLTFVPSRYLYTTQGGALSVVTNLLGAAWVVSLLAILWQWRAAPRALIVASLAFPAYYLLVSWGISLKGSGRFSSRRSRE